MTGELFGSSRVSPQCRANSREQLWGAERLGYIVVGTRIQRRDFLCIHRSRRKHDDRHLGPLANFLITLSPSPSGKPRSTNKRSGLWLRASISPRAAVVCLDDSICSACSSTRRTSRIPASSSMTRTWCIAWVTKDSLVGKVKWNRAPPPGRSPARSLHRALARWRDRSQVRDPRRDGALIGATLKLVEHSVGLTGRQSWPFIVDSDPNEIFHRLRGNAHRVPRRVLPSVVQ